MVLFILMTQEKSLHFLAMYFIMDKVNGQWGSANGLFVELFLPYRAISSHGRNALSVLFKRIENA